MALPVWTAGWVAVALLAAALFALATRRIAPRRAPHRRRKLWQLPGWFEPACGAAGVLGFVLAVAGGLTNQFAVDRASLHFWAVACVASAMLGDVVRPFSPWRAVARALGADRTSRPLPDAVGRWPAAVGLLVLIFALGASPDAWQPRVAALVLLTYAAVQVAGALRYGSATWDDRGDGLGLSLTLFARLAPLDVDGGWLSVRRPLVGVFEITWLPGTAALLAGAIAAAAYDALTHHTGWLEQGTDGAPQAVLVAAGLALSCGAVLAVIQVALQGMRKVAPRDTAQLVAILGLALIPTTLSYIAVHYALGAFPPTDTLILTQAAIVIAGHLVALFVAYDHSVVVLRNFSLALRALYCVVGVLMTSAAFEIWLVWQASAAAPVIS
jgi:hypothetical protein